MKILLAVYDNQAHASEFPLGLGYIASALVQAGHQVEVYSKDVYHYPNEHLTNYLDKNIYDIIGVSTVAGYWQYAELLRISKAINSSVNRPFYMIGGHGPAAEPEFYLRKTGADCVVIGEGEVTVTEMTDDMPNWRKVDGIAYMKDNKLVKTKPRSLIKDLDIVPFPAWDLFEINHYVMSPFPNMKHYDRTFPVLSSRGCIFHCRFCFRLDKGYRVRSPENVIEEIRQLQEKHFITYISFYDELFMSSPKRMTEMCNAIIDSGLQFRWNCDGRLNFAKPEVLKLMKKAGCVFINYGIESYDNQVMKNMHKSLTTEIAEQGVKNTLAAGISPGINIIFGNFGDTPETLKKGVEFTKKYHDYAYLRTIKPVTPYPGCELYYDAIRLGLLKDVKDFYENKHLNSDLMAVNFTDLTDDEFYDEMYKANKILLKADRDNSWKENLKLLDELYRKRDPNFRGFRET